MGVFSIVNFLNLVLCTTGTRIYADEAAGSVSLGEGGGRAQTDDGKRSKLKVSSSAMSF